MLMLIGTLKSFSQAHYVIAMTSAATYLNYKLLKQTQRISDLKSKTPPCMAQLNDKHKQN